MSEKPSLLANSLL